MENDRYNTLGAFTPARYYRATRLGEYESETYMDDICEEYEPCEFRVNLERIDKRLSEKKKPVRLDLFEVNALRRHIIEQQLEDATNETCK